MVRTGALAENSQQQGFSHFLPRLALTHSEGFSAAQLQSFWQQTLTSSDKSSLPASTSYDFTLYDLSLPNGRSDLLKEALAWLGNTASNLDMTQSNIEAAQKITPDPVAAIPANSQDAWWRYRLTGSTLLGHDPAALPTTVIQSGELQNFYHQWYTPDAMVLYVVGNVDARGIAEQINKTFSVLKGHREKPQMMPMLADVAPKTMVQIDNSLSINRLSLLWNMPWQPIQDSQALNHYWQADLAREAMFVHLQQVLSAAEKSSDKDKLAVPPMLGVDCRVQYQRAQCAIRLEVSKEKTLATLKLLLQALVKLRDEGISPAEFDELLKVKNAQLATLFATYARTDTAILMSQRLRSQQNGVVDIAPEQYQRLRQAFVNTVSLPLINQELHQQLQRQASLLLVQGAGGDDITVGQLQESYDTIMRPLDVPVASGELPAVGKSVSGK
jgi:zinc protease